MSAPELSVVIPICNEEEVLPELGRRLRTALHAVESDYEIILVNDGSDDHSLAIMRGMRESDPRIKIIDFSRNFGHQLAVSAGIDHAQGQAVVVMDGDLQDPPEVLPRLIERWRQGYQVVYAVRRKRKEGFAKRTAYAIFYRLLHRISKTEIPLDSGDFSLMDRRVVDVLKHLPERNRFIRGLRAWAGFEQIAYEYERDARVSGEPKYKLMGLLRLAVDGILAFSETPLRIATVVGLGVSAAGALLAVWTLAERIVDGQVVPGFATLAILILFFGGVQLVTIGILGEYVARIYTEVKRRPHYVVRQLEGLASISRSSSEPKE